MASNGADQPFHLATLERVVVLDVPAEWFEVVEALALRRLVGFTQHEELQLRSRHRSNPGSRGTFELTLENGARCNFDERLAFGVMHITQHQRGTIQPRGAAQTREVG